MFALVNKQTNSIQMITSNFYDETEEVICITIPENLNVRFIKVEIVEDVLTIVEDSIALNSADKITRIESKRVKMLSDIAAGQKAVYGTASETSALSYHLTYKDMVENPSDWIGDLFVDADAVLAYATPKLAASKAFGLVRLARIAQYQAEVAAINAE